MSKSWYWHPLPESQELGLKGWGWACKFGHECGTQKYGLFSINLVLKCRHLLSQPVSPELCNAVEAMVRRDVAVQEGKGAFAVDSQLLPLSPVIERESQSSPVGQERKEGL